MVEVSRNVCNTYFLRAVIVPYSNFQTVSYFGLFVLNTNNTVLYLYDIMHV